MPIYSIDGAPNQIPKSYSAHGKQNIDFIITGPEITALTRLKYNMTYSVASFDPA